MPVAVWKQTRDERCLDFEIKVMKAKAIRGHLAAALRAGAGVALLLQSLTSLTLGVYLNRLLVAYGFPEGMVAELGAAIETLVLQDAGGFDELATSVLNMVNVIDHIDLVSHRLKAYAWPASRNWLWWPWCICGGFLSLILHDYGLTPYWAVASWLLSSGVLWSAAIAWGFGRWYAAITIPALFGWMYVFYKDVVMKAMCDDAARLEKGLVQLANGELLFPESMHTVLPELRDRGWAVLEQLRAAQRAAERTLSYLGFSAPLIIVGDGGAAAALPPPPDQPGGQQGGHQPRGGSSGGDGGRGRAVEGAGSGSGGGGMGRASAVGGGVGRDSSPLLTAPGIVSQAAAVPPTSASQPAHVASQAIRGAGPSSGATTFPTTAAPLSGAAGELGPQARQEGVGFLPRGVHGCGSGVGSYVGSDSTLAAAAATHASGASTPPGGVPPVVPPAGAVLPPTAGAPPRSGL